MPYGWIDPEMFLEHKDVTVYHVYKDDEIDAGRRECWYTLDPGQGEVMGDDDAIFDIRDLPNPNHRPHHADQIRDLIDAGFVVVAPGDGSARLDGVKIETAMAAEEV